MAKKPKHTYRHRQGRSGPNTEMTTSGRDAYILSYKVPRLNNHPLLLKLAHAGGGLIQSRQNDLYLYLNPKLYKTASSTLVFAIMSDLATRTGAGPCLMTLLDLPVYRERVCRRVSLRPDSANPSGPEYLRARRRLLPGGRIGSLSWTMPNWRDAKPGSPWEPCTEAILFRLVNEWKRELTFFRAKGIDPMIGGSLS